MHVTPDDATPVVAQRRLHALHALRDELLAFDDVRVTVGWAIHSLETAIGKLGAGTAERRVRDQLHQLIHALERDGHNVEATRLVCEKSGRNPERYS